ADRARRAGAALGQPRALRPRPVARAAPAERTAARGARTGFAMTAMVDPRWGEALARLPDYLGAHVQVSVAALALGLAVSLPLALAARHRPALRGALLGIASIVQTVPGLALL